MVGKADRALACGSPSHDNVEARDGLGTNSLRGLRSVILVNDFSQNQCDTTRSIVAAWSFDDAVELGWFKVEPDAKRVFWVRVQDGIVHAPNLSTHTPSGGTDHSFKIVNADGGYNWSVIYDGDPLSTGVRQAHQTAFASYTNSERDQAGEDLYARFSELQICTAGCNFHDPNNFTFYGGTPGWHWCKDSETEQHVRGSGSPC